MFAAPHFHDDEAARRLLEEVRWPSERSCPHCGTVGRSYATKRTQKCGATVYRCGEPECRKDFSVTTNSVMESSHIPLHKWLQGFYLMASSKKGVSAHQLHRTLKITYKAAWFMAHRIREAMRADGTFGPLGGEGQIVEADETYYGHRDDKRLGKTTIRGKRGLAGKRPIIALVERGGSVRSFYAAVADKEAVTKIVAENVARESYLYTDESRLYGDADQLFAEHATVKHSAGEYVRYEGERTIHTNTVENVFSVFKRGMRGVYQHCAEKHLHRYLSEFDFRYNHRSALGVEDEARTLAAIAGAPGKRLTYRRPD
ncbi:IS1595 family transposase [Mesorhizobium sp. B3-1-6]|uniref:IS1595 family transposase n=1 Tax=Mesorhizobium sp. B3-1-6 TaxID=2589895 RepID=UPI00112CE43E|nr:IS1595 family transposase [Mesorhizobium sp. B3-1-6]TPI43688.1 IS1595 family transposase [Mesorhizobium sp. B3-1-6]